MQMQTLPIRSLSSRLGRSQSKCSSLASLAIEAHASGREPPFSVRFRATKQPMTLLENFKINFNCKLKIFNFNFKLKNSGILSRIVELKGRRNTVEKAHELTFQSQTQAQSSLLVVSADNCSNKT
jgi:hypothetical protein